MALGAVRAQGMWPSEPGSARAELGGDSRPTCRTWLRRGCAALRANIVTKPGQKESSWLALACEQTGLLGHRCKNENTGVKVRIKWRIPVFCRFCEIGIRPWNMPDTAGGSGKEGVCLLWAGGDSCGIGIRIAIQHSTTWRGMGQNSSGGSVWALPLLSQAGPAWLSTQAFQLSG